MQIKIDFSKNLRLCREKQGLTQKQLAERIGYTEKSVSKWENGGGFPSLEVVAQLAVIFGVSINELVYQKTQDRYCLGIDGGGTKTVFKMEDEKRKTLRTVVKGASNPNDIGIDAAKQLLDEGIREVCGDISYGSIAMFAGISGGGLTGNYAKVLHRHFEKYGFLTFENGSDIENLAALAENDPCVLVIMGTGFIVFAQHNAARHRLAGWGQYFDDGGSGYTIGRDAVCAALRALDGSGAPTLLGSLIEKRLGESVEAHVSAFYREGKKSIADMADLVFSAAEAGDAAAQGILERNMAFAAEIIDAALSKIPTDAPVPVYFSGGISAQHATLFPLIRRHLRAKNHQLIHLEKSPVDGALIHARRLLDEKQTADP